MKKKYISLDIGGTKMLGCVFDEQKNIIFRIKKKTKPEKGFEKIEEKIFSLIDELIEESQTQKSDIIAIAAGIPGIINDKEGEIVYSPNIPFKNYNIKKAIELRYDTKFYLGNDVNFGVLGEWKYGIGIGKANIVGIFIGTGIGGGLILENNLYKGTSFSAGEIGHMVLNSQGPSCNCGQMGCLEAFASKIAMSRDILAQISRGRKTLMSESFKEGRTIFKSKELKKAIDSKDEVAIEIVDKASYYLSIAIGSLTNILNPEMVIIGGGIAESIGDYIIPLIKKNVVNFTMPELLNTVSIVKSKLGDDAVLYGGLSTIQLYEKI